MESKGLRVNGGKTKVMISSSNAGSVNKKGKYPCSVCHKGLGSNSAVIHAIVGPMDAAAV